MYSAIMDVPHYWTADQVKRLLDSLASHNQHQARTAALIMWRTRPAGLRGPRAGMAGPGLLGGSGDAAGPEVEEPACPHGAAAPGSGAAVHELAGEPVAAGQAGVAEHADGPPAHRGWDRMGGSGRGIPWDRAAARWRSQPEAQCRPALVGCRWGSAKCGQLLVGTRQRPGDPADLPSHCRKRLQHGRGALARPPSR